jgi:lipopolysaccharide transport system ATP-binding protein
MDEAIGAGDAHFVEKAALRLQAALERAKILVIATHAGHIAQKWCNRALWIDQGRIVMEGTPKEVWVAYSKQR